MRKYKGNLDAAGFLRELNQACGHNPVACCNCPHHNGDCVEWARKGTCILYSQYAPQMEKQSH